MKYKIGNLVREVNYKTTENNQFQVLTSSQEGILSQAEYFNRNVASNNNVGYKIIKKGQFTYRSMSDTGYFYINLLKDYDIGIISPAYPVFEIIDTNIILNEYLEIFFRTSYFMENAKKHATGSTRLSLKYKQICNIEIEVPGLEEQRKVIESITNIKKAINNRSNTLKDLKKLLDSKFEEMFGDFDINPKSYDISTIGDECIINPKKSEMRECEDEELFNFLAMPSVSEDGEVDYSIMKPYEEIKKGFTYFKNGDILFAKITPCMENGKGALLDNLVNEYGFGSTEFHVLRTKENLDPTWLFSITKSTKFRKLAESKMTGSAGQKRVPISFISDYKIIVPPLEEQIKYSEFYKETYKHIYKIKKEVIDLNQILEKNINRYFCNN